ncbi:nucleotidyltransferase domain-containing protein, partial [Acinetobacter baumannii]
MQLLHKYISSSLLLNQFNDLNLPKFNLMITKENILSLLKKHKEELLKLGVSDIGLFGSYVFDKQTDKSDIDLLIDFEPEREN